ncbi:MAG: DUF1844 domain-containing protein [Armatimonadetes bacterium]|nr:DUF1844 domain-containing protein [Armatimonadota bacterium]
MMPEDRQSETSENRDAREEQSPRPSGEATEPQVNSEEAAAPMPPEHEPDQADASSAPDQAEQPAASGTQPAEAASASDSAEETSGEQAEQAQAASSEPSAGQASEGDTGPGQIRPATISELVEMALALFLEHAWVSLGLRVLPGMTEAQEDLEGARVAIDCAGFLFEKYAPTAPDEQRRRLELELTNLRLNYARKVE